ncbi:palmitoyltransferase pfa5 [Monascus purpureus]|nr:palmitoyltransferase pfa5 [Monascus purpureus]
MARRGDARANLAVARVLPPIIIGIIAYICYDITKQVGIDYLIHPSGRYRRRPRVGSGIAIIVIFYVLLIFFLSTYLRLWQKVNLDPGYLPRGAQWIQKQEEAGRTSRRHRRRYGRKHSRTSREGAEKTDQPEVDLESRLDYNAPGKAFPLDTAGLESFYTKDIFICQDDGRPPYCSKCFQFKTDRAHHCREVDRCVRKMDHFCPWVGGVVSETSFKFFIQFVFYTALLCIFVLIVFVVFTAELRREAHRVNAHWIVGIALSALFGIFSFAMTVSSLQLAMKNLTTIENINHRSKVWTIAIRIPDSLVPQTNPGMPLALPYQTITYPQPDMSPPSLESEGFQRPTTGERHVFAILRTQPGENPFDLGSMVENLQQILGHSIADWFLPFKQSPCADHSGSQGAFAFGPVVTRLKRESGLEPRTAGSLNRSSNDQRTV